MSAPGAQSKRGIGCAASSPAPRPSSICSKSCSVVTHPTGRLSLRPRTRRPTGFQNCSSFRRSRTERTRTNVKTFFGDLNADNTKPSSRRRYSTKALICRRRRWRSFWAAALRRANTLSGSVAFSANERTSKPSFTRSRRVGRWRPPSAGGDARPKLTPDAPENSLSYDDMLPKELLRYRIESGQIRPAFLGAASPRYIRVVSDLIATFDQQVGNKQSELEDRKSVV